MRGVEVQRQRDAVGEVPFPTPQHRGVGRDDQRLEAQLLHLGDEGLGAAAPTGGVELEPPRVVDGAGEVGG